ncbi:MAG: GDP-mannose 4,6-dehydratase [Gammaproteobacteria bacterium]|nr:GDP-mannose 4,6-dehydratase [Gammaproteobacteria bacterium]
MKYLISGGCGFIGANLAEQVISHHHTLDIIDNLSRIGSEKNLAFLKTKGKFIFHKKDIRSASAVETIIKKTQPDVIFHLAGQVAMTTSVAQPRVDFEINALGTLNLLEAVRKWSPASIIIYSSTNKVYGDLSSIAYQEKEYRYEAVDFPKGFNETFPLAFSTPYGCSKGCADQYMLDYHAMFGLRTVVFRHSSVFGAKQFSTYDQGWIGWFVKQALETALKINVKPFTISGSGKQVRDVIFIDDIVNCYFSAIKHIDEIAGEAFNIGGGYQNSLSLLELFNFLNEELKINLNYETLAWRKSDQKVFIADIEKAQQKLKWHPQISKRDGLKKMMAWIEENRGFYGI